MNPSAIALLDHLQTLLTSRKNDAHLSHILDVAPPVISKLRHGRLEVGPTLIIKVHEAFGMPISDIKAMAGLPAYVGGA